MNRLTHFLRAKNQYNIHSPYVYRLYTEVLLPPRPITFEAMAQMLKRWNQPEREEYSSSPDCLTLFKGDCRLLLLEAPHRHEALFQQLSSSDQYQVSIYLYDYALFIADPRLHPQHFLLR